MDGTVVLLFEHVLSAPVVKEQLSKVAAAVILLYCCCTLNLI